MVARQSPWQTREKLRVTQSAERREVAEPKSAGVLGGGGAVASARQEGGVKERRERSAAGSEAGNETR